jgi:peptide deformylase
MLALMRAHAGIGLAGPQVGLSQRLFVAEFEGQSVCLANPVILERGGRDRMAEGCLSLPGLNVELDRDHQVAVEGYDIHGQKEKHLLEGLWARIMQHEIDHLDGVLICDHEGQRAPQ